jgi:hypothetical protein
MMRDDDLFRVFKPGQAVRMRKLLEEERVRTTFWSLLCLVSNDFFFCLVDF